MGIELAALENRQDGNRLVIAGAALHAQVYGEAVDVVTLIPHMLEAFMAEGGDSGDATKPRLSARNQNGAAPSVIEAKRTHG